MYKKCILCVSGIIENAFKDIKNYPVVNTKQMYHYCPQLNNYRIILQCKVNNKKLKFISPIPSSPMRKGKKNQLLEVYVKSTISSLLKLIKILILVGIGIAFL